MGFFRFTTKPVMYYTYVLQSLTSDIFYIGQTNNLEDRLNRHNQNRNKYTRGKGPWKMIYSRSFNTRSEAVQLELKLKGFKNGQGLFVKKQL